MALGDLLNAALGGMSEKKALATVDACIALAAEAGKAAAALEAAPKAGEKRKLAAQLDQVAARYQPGYQALFQCLARSPRLQAVFGPANSENALFSALFLLPDSSQRSPNSLHSSDAEIVEQLGLLRSVLLEPAGTAPAQGARKLDLGGIAITDVRDFTVARFMRLLLPAGYFAILEGEGEYIQAIKADEGEAYEFEHDVGECREHYRAASPLPLDEVLRRFELFRRGEGSWREGLDFEDAKALVAPEGGGSGGAPKKAKKGASKAKGSGKGRTAPLVLRYESEKGGHEAAATEASIAKVLSSGDLIVFDPVFIGRPGGDFLQVQCQGAVWSFNPSSDGYTLQYFLGDEGRYGECDVETSNAKILALALDYAAGGEGWKGAAPWESYPGHLLPISVKSEDEDEDDYEDEDLSLGEVKKLLDKGLSPDAVLLAPSAYPGSAPDSVHYEATHLFEDYVDRALNGHIKEASPFLKLLLAKGADPLKPYREGEGACAFFDAVTCDSEEASYKLTKLFLEAGVDPRATNAEGNDAFDLVEFKSVRQLLEKAAEAGAAPAKAAPSGAAPAAGAATCAACGAVLEPGAKFCSECGERVAEEASCAACGAKLKRGAKFCPECGAKVAPTAR